MYEVKKSIETGQPYGLYNILKQLQHLGAGIAGEVYFVDGGDGSDTYDGLSWDNAFKTIAYAITKSNANIVANVAARNTIFIRGDLFAEDLTVPPIKCDVIGVGSSDEQNKAKITGEHAWTGSTTNESSGFYNIEFQNDGTTAIFTVATPSGLYFGDCCFTAEAACVGAILLTGATGNDFVMKNCWLRNALDNDPFDTAAISITVTTFYHMLIENCKIEGDIGIDIDSTNMYNGIVTGCTIKGTGLVIDDESNDVTYTNNAFITAAANTANDMLDWNVALAARNVATGATNTNTAPVEAT